MKKECERERDGGLINENKLRCWEVKKKREEIGSNEKG